VSENPNIRADEDHTVIDRDGQRSQMLLALRSLLRGQARHVAETILDHPPLFDTMRPVIVMEYSI
jgi:hypothetical protein